MGETDKVEIRVAELLASRLCHELVGVAGAVANGVELLGELEPGDMSDDAMRLVSKSAGQIIARLKFYRLAYGFAGRVSDDIPELRSVTHAFVDGGHIRLSWPLPPMVPELAEGGGKLLLNMIVLGAESLIRGGVLSVEVDEAVLTVTAEGDDAGLPREIRDALEGRGNAVDLTARAVQGYWTRLLGGQAGFAVKYSAEGNRVSIVATTVV